MVYSKWKGSVPDVTFRTWYFKRKKKILSLHSYLKRSMPETLFGRLTNLLYSVRKHLSAVTLYTEVVKWFAMQNSWLVSELSTFLVTGVFKQVLTHFQSIIHLNKPVSWFLLGKCLKKHLWKSDILRTYVEY